MKKIAYPNIVQIACLSCGYTDPEMVANRGQKHAVPQEGETIGCRCGAIMKVVPDGLMLISK